MSLESLQTMARFLAGRNWVEGGKEAVILDRLKGAAGDLPALFDEWRLEPERREEMARVCLGFSERSAALPALPRPVLPGRPTALTRFLTTRPVLLFQPSPERAVLGTSDPLAAAYAGELALMLGQPVDLVLLTPSEVALGQQTLGAAFDEHASRGADAHPAPIEHYDESSGPVVQLVDLIVQEGIRRNASDIHVEPAERRGVVRYRLDGVLVKAREYPVELHPAVASRCKVMAGMDISERRLPQDGRIRYKGDGAEVDLRVASFPSAHGEAVSIRILGRSAQVVDLERGGFRPELLAALRSLFGAAQGMILATGPTGCGKTTTLYGVLRELNEVGTRIVTIEDPIEYQIEGIVQVQANQKAGLTFAAGLRAFLRGDPDIIMVGEIRDHETADIAIKAALTGHLVLATVHTNSAAGALTRLIDMGFEPYNLSATIQGVLAQRLCRRVCRECAGSVPTPATAAAQFRACGMVVPLDLPVARGCAACGGVGYDGRIGVHELLVMTPSLETAVNQKAPEQQLMAIAAGQGMMTLMQDALLKVAGGVTTMDEVARVLGAGAEPEDRK